MKYTDNLIKQTTYENRHRGYIMNKTHNYIFKIIGVISVILLSFYYINYL